MIPILDVIPTRSAPVATLTLIAINAFAFIFQLSTGDDGKSPSIFGVLGSLFVHHGALPFLINLLFLWLFGDNVEDQLGRLRFVIFYVLCGLTGVVAQTLIAAGARGPLIGASGAVGGVLGAYFLLYPRSRVLMFFPLPLTLHELPAVAFLGFWFMLQLIALAAQAGFDAAGVNVAPGLFAHAVAFVTGAFLCLALRRPERARVEWWGA